VNGELTRRLRWVALAVVLLVAGVIAAHLAGLTLLATVLTPAVGVGLIVLAAWAIQSREHLHRK
jgi:hypothetical protein